MESDRRHKNDNKMQKPTKRRNDPNPQRERTKKKWNLVRTVAEIVGVDVVGFVIDVEGLHNSGIDPCLNQRVPLQQITLTNQVEFVAQQTEGSEVKVRRWVW